METVDFDALASDLMHLHNPLNYHHKRPADKRAHSKGYVLFYLVDHGGRAAPNELGDALNVNSSRITAILNNLESDGYVSRTISEMDRRKIVVSITQLGEAYVSEYMQEKQENMARLLKRLGPADAREYVRIMHRLEELE